MDAYGPGQSFLHYRHFPHRRELDHVFYVYYANDLRNIYETGLFRLDHEGKLLQITPPARSPWRTLVSRLHISYLFLDATRRWSIATLDESVHQPDGKPEPRGLTSGEERYVERYRDTRADAIWKNLQRGHMDDPDVQDSVAVFKQLMAVWKRSVEANAGRFHIVLVPDSTRPSIASLLGDDFSVIDLHDCFAERGGGWGSGYRFQNDPHWNEAGNRLVAVCLYRFFEQETDVPVLSEEDLEAALERYYAAFDESDGTEGHERNPIRSRYAALDQQHNGTLTAEEGAQLTSVQRRARAEHAASKLEQFEKLTAEAGEPVVRGGGWKVYYVSGGHLYYSREDCPAEALPIFFLHLFPADVRDLPESRRPHGYDNLDFRISAEPVAGRCFAVRELPDYALAEVRTGQYLRNAGRLWEARFQPAGPPTPERAGR